MSDKKDIDAIWKALNAPRPGRATALGGGITSMPGVSSTSRVLPPRGSAASNTEPVIKGMAGTVTSMASMGGTPVSAAAAGAAKAAAAASSASGGAHGDVQRLPMLDDVAMAAESRRHAGHYDPARAGVSAEELSAYVSAMQRTINCLSDPDRSTRKAAACALLARLTKGDVASPPPSPQLLQALLCGPLLYPATQLLHDPGEATRLTAAELLVHGATTVPDFSAVLPVLMPEVVRRMGNLPVVEPAEEVRLLLTTLVAAVVARADEPTLSAYGADLCTFLLRAFEDGYHEIKKAACACCVSLAGRAPPGVVEASSEKLLGAVLPNLGHQHSRVRLSVIEALEALIVGRCIPAALVRDTAAPALRPVAYDRAPAVREALFAALARWLGAPPPPPAGGDSSGASSSSSASAPIAAPSRATASVLLPLLLVGLSDAQPGLAAKSLALVEAVGEAWTGRAKAGDMEGVEPPAATTSATDADADAYAERAAAALGLPAPYRGRPGAGARAMVCVCSRVPMPLKMLGQCHSRAYIKTHQTCGVVCALGLPAPYRGRPAHGARAMVVELLPALLPPVVAELGEWTVTLRQCAVRQLHSLLVLAEAGATPLLPSLLPSLCASIGDEAPDIATCVMGSVHVLGAHARPRHWVPLMLDQVSNSKLSLMQKANTLVVLSGLLHSAAKVGADASDVPDDVLSSLTAALAADDMRSSEHPAIRQQLLSVCRNLMAWQGPRCVAVARQLYTLLLQLYGFERDAGRLADVSAAMSQLASAVGRDDGGFAALAADHGPAVLDAAVACASDWSAEAPGYLVFRALLLTSGPDTLASLVPRLVDALAPLLENHEADANLRLGALQLLDQLLEDAVRRDALGGGAAGLVVTRLLLPPLVWRAGKSAAAVRFGAITALATALRNRLAPAALLLELVEGGTLLPLLHQSLDEDWYTDLRRMACFVEEQLLLSVGPSMGDAARRAVYVELLKRLDDASNAVRVGACGALTAFCTTMPATYCDTNSGYLAAGVVVHMDDSAPEVQEAACRVLEALAAVKPIAVAKEVGKVVERFRSKHYCDRVLAACGAAGQRGGG
ncbi:hypothetical protein FOA52_009395 [Chlamydomonas sp. UWO 241]|nr:hypothetical protein FOA52_009395 [Chlamydomonas sp. UWO 241]